MSVATKGRRHRPFWHELADGEWHEVDLSRTRSPNARNAANAAREWGPPNGYVADVSRRGEVVRVRFVPVAELTDFEIGYILSVAEIDWPLPNASVLGGELGCYRGVAVYFLREMMLMGLLKRERLSSTRYQYVLTHYGRQEKARIQSEIDETDSAA